MPLESCGITRPCQVDTYDSSRTLVFQSTTPRNSGTKLELSLALPFLDNSLILPVVTARIASPVKTGTRAPHVRKGFRAQTFKDNLSRRAFWTLHRNLFPLLRPLSRLVLWFVPAQRFECPRYSDPHGLHAHAVGEVRGDAIDSGSLLWSQIKRNSGSVEPGLHHSRFSRSGDPRWLECTGGWCH
jgi:hypothetical protein